jgi:phospholipid N-methyltransferase
MMTFLYTKRLDKVLIGSLNRLNLNRPPSVAYTKRFVCMHNNLFNDVKFCLMLITDSGARYKPARENRPTQHAVTSLPMASLSTSRTSSSLSSLMALSLSLKRKIVIDLLKTFAAPNQQSMHRDVEP